MTYVKFFDDSNLDRLEESVNLWLRERTSLTVTQTTLCREEGRWVLTLTLKVEER